MKVREKTDKGITLVALVVTIVVTIILAGISIGYILGDSSIIKVAQNSVEETDNAIKKEQDDLQNLVNLLHGEEETIPPEDTTTYNITIQYIGKNNSEISQKKVIEGVKNGAKYVASDYVISIPDYVYVSASTEQVIVNGKDETIILSYAEDILADPVRDANGNLSGDGIADYLQYQVEYIVHNGTFTNEGTRYIIAVTKMLDGVPSEDGIAILEKGHIPASTPNTGYGTGTWDDSTPTIGNRISANTTFTFTYKIMAPVVPGI